VARSSTAPTEGLQAAAVARKFVFVSAHWEWAALRDVFASLKSAPLNNRRRAENPPAAVDTG
jgi:hypothetical protein